MVFHFVQGILYTITDVKDLHEWMVDHLQRHSLFERILGDELVNLTNEIKFFFYLGNFVPNTQFILYFQNSDPVVEKLYETSEEGQKVTRNNGDKFVAIFRRIKLQQT